MRVSLRLAYRPRVASRLLAWRRDFHRREQHLRALRIPVRIEEMEENLILRRCTQAAVCGLQQAVLETDAKYLHLVAEG